MNHERMLKVADLIEANPDHFDMSSYADVPGHAWIGPWHTDVLLGADLFDCGTTACIAGWATWLWAAEVDPDDSIDLNAQQILDLDPEYADRLFANFDLTTASMAAEYLREEVQKDQER